MTVFFNPPFENFVISFKTAARSFVTAGAPCAGGAGGGGGAEGGAGGGGGAAGAGGERRAREGMGGAEGE